MLSLALGEPLHDGSRECDPKVVSGPLEAKYLSQDLTPEFQSLRDVKLPAGKILIPGVVSHSTDLVEHPELLADRIITFAEIVGRETSSPAPTAA